MKYKLYSEVLFFPYDMKTFVESNEKSYLEKSYHGVITEIKEDGIYEVSIIKTNHIIGIYFYVPEDKIICEVL